MTCCNVCYVFLKFLKELSYIEMCICLYKSFILLVSHTCTSRLKCFKLKLRSIAIKAICAFTLYFVSHEYDYSFILLWSVNLTLRKMSRILLFVHFYEGIWTRNQHVLGRCCTYFANLVSRVWDSNELFEIIKWYSYFFLWYRCVC